MIDHMVQHGIYLDPTLSVAQSYAQFFAGNADVFNNSLVQQVVPAKMLQT